MPRAEVRNTALQSRTAPSVMNTMKQRTPMNITMPRGKAKRGPSLLLPYGSRCGAAIASATTMPAITMSVAVSGDAPAPRSAVVPAAPTMPPRLKRPWNPDIIGRPLARDREFESVFLQRRVCGELRSVASA
jgi:hypothetical protein